MGLRVGTGIWRDFTFLLWLLLTVGLFVVAVRPVGAAVFGQSEESGTAAPLDLDSDWQYRWGDSPVDSDGVPVWTRDGPNDPAWSDIGFPSNPPGRDGRENVWYRVALPEGDWRDPVLYIYSIDLIAEVYMGGEKIYGYGTFDGQGKGRFEGWPWHMIPLPRDFGGQYIYFRIFSDYYDIGLWGEVKVMDRLDLIQYVLHNSIGRIVVAGLSLLITVLAFVFALMQDQRRTVTLIGLYSASAGLMVLSGAQAKQLLLNAPLLWDHVGAASYFLLPVFMAALFQGWCRGRGVRVIGWIWRGHLAFAVAALAASVAGWVNLSDMYAVFDVLFAVTLFVMFAVAFLQLRMVGPDARLAIAAFGVFGLFLLIDMAVARGLLPWTRMPTATGLLVFTLALIGLSLRRVIRTQRALMDLTATLEDKVQARTQALERSNRDLQMFASAVSHDLQAPLRAISGHLGLLQRRCGDDLDDRGRAFIGYAIDGARQMSEMIQAMLVYARVESQGGAFLTVDTTRTAREAIDTLDIAHTCPEARISVADLPPVAGDPVQVRSLFQNLIGNALKYRHPDRTPDIRVSGARTDGRVSLRIDDNGLGMDPGDRDRAFQMFARLHDPQNYPGTGMGLALCERIVKRHGGSIDLDGRRGEGCSVIVTLPAPDPSGGPV